MGSHLCQPEEPLPSNNPSPFKRIKPDPKQDESEPVEEDMSFDNESLMHSDQGSDLEQNRKAKQPENEVEVQNDSFNNNDEEDGMGEFQQQLGGNH